MLLALLGVFPVFGGILLCYNKRVLAIKDEWVGSFSVSVLVEDLTNSSS